MKSTWIFCGGTALLAGIVALVGAFASPTWTYAIGSVLIVGELSLMGVFALSISPRTLNSLTRALIGVGAGAMLGNAMLHLVPEAFEPVSDGEISALTVSVLMSLGFLFLFVLEKGLNFSCHQAGVFHHGPEQCSECSCEGNTKPKPAHCGAQNAHVHDEHDGHDHHEVESHKHIDPTGHMSWVAHMFDTFKDGILIGIAFQVNIPLGIATTVAIIAHEPFLQLGGFAVQVRAGIRPATAVLLNLTAAFVALMGTVSVMALGTYFKHLPVYMTPVAAGLALFLAFRLILMIREEQDLKRSLFVVGMAILGFSGLAAIKLAEVLLVGHAH